MEAGAGPHDDLNGATPPRGDAQACPLLGFVDDPIRHFWRPSYLHRCYAYGSGDPVSSATQSELCLAASHTRCERFLEANTQIAARASEHAPTEHAPARPRYQAPLGLVANGAESANGSVEVLPEPLSTGATVTSTRALAAASSGPTTPPPPSEDQQGPPESPSELSSEPPPLQPNRGGPVRVVRGLLIASVALLALIILVVAGPLRQPAPPALRVDLTQPTAVPTAAPTLAPPAAAAPTTLPPPSAATSVPPTAVPTLIAAPLVNVRFDTRQATWPDNPPYATWSAGAYRLAARDQSRFVAVSAPIADVPADVEVRAMFQKTGGPAGGGYGVILRNQSTAPLDGAQQNGAYYVLEFGDRGEVGAWRRDEDRWVELMPWTQTGINKPANAVTVMQARAAGDVLTLSVDGSQILQVEDGTLAAGGVGVFVGGDGNQVALLALSLTRAD